MPLIHIIGNLCAGKTTVAKWLKKQIPSIMSVSIDQYRIKYSDGTKDGEEKAWVKLETNIEQWILVNRLVIMESSGTSWRMKYFPIGLVILIDTSLQECKTRVMKRGKTDVPWPWPGDPVDSLQPIEEKINQRVAYLQVHYPKRILIVNNNNYKDVIDNEDFLNFIEKSDCKTHG